MAGTTTAADWRNILRPEREAQMGNLSREGPMGSGFEALFAKYGWVWIGLSFGFLAKYALLIKRGVQVKVRLVLADLLLLPMVALIAFSLVTQINNV